MVRRSETEPGAEPFDRDERLGEAIEAFLALMEVGASPDPDEFAARYPGLEEDLLAALEGLAMVQGLVGEPGREPGGAKLETGRRVAGYRIVRELGRGGMGVVYEAVHVGLDRPVALKVLGTNAAPDSNGRRRFLNEARTAAGLAPHAHRAGVRRRPGRRLVLLRDATDRRKRPRPGRPPSSPRPPKRCPARARPSAPRARRFCFWGVLARAFRRAFARRFSAIARHARGRRGTGTPRGTTTTKVFRPPAV